MSERETYGYLLESIEEIKRQVEGAIHPADLISAISRFQDTASEYEESAGLIPEATSEWGREVKEVIDVVSALQTEPTKRVKLRKGKTPEGKVKDSIKKILDDPRIWYFMPVQTGYGVKGIPDFIGCYEGQAFAIEAKAGKGSITLLQGITLNKMYEAGFQTFIINENNLEELEKWITG